MCRSCCSGHNHCGFIGGIHIDFKNVPKEYRPVPFWSWNDELKCSETVRQIEEMDDKGIGGFFMHARGGLTTEYMGEEWFDNVEAAIKAAEETGGAATRRTSPYTS